MNIELIFNHLNENITKINELYNTKNSDINLIKNKYFLFLSNKIELKKNNNFKLEKDSDICIGFQTNQDCMIKILYKNNNDKGVIITTIHKCKGFEYDNVIFLDNIPE